MMWVDRCEDGLMDSVDNILTLLSLVDGSDTVVGTFAAMQAARHHAVVLVLFLDNRRVLAEPVNADAERTGIEARHHQTLKWSDCLL